MAELDFNITIVGLGLIGGSFAMALKELRPQKLWAVDINEAVIKSAEDIGIIDKGFLDPRIPLEKSDIVIMCIYPNATIKFIKDNMDCFKAGSIVTDTVGVKDRLLKEISSFMRNDVDFIPGHPMAGREYKGFEYASKDIFTDASYIMTPTGSNNKENIKIIEGIMKKIGFKNIVKTSPEEHDEIMAFTSHLPHVIATSLINGSDGYDIKYFTAGSFKDVTRVAKINSDLWTELLMNNSENILNQIKVFEENIGAIKRSIMNNSREDLKLLFDKGRNKREDLI